MGEVIYKLNGKIWRDYNFFVSASRNLVGKLAPKPVLNHDWAEYHGLQYDLDVKTRYQERKIALDIFVVGDNWDEIVTNYNAIMDEFDNKGVQRLIVEPFDNKPLVYDVMLTGTTELKKTFRDGKMFATATLNLIEPSPIKKILKLKDSGIINLKFSSDTWVDISFGDNSFNEGQVIRDRGDIDITTNFFVDPPYVIIAGNIENITNFTSNLEVVWEKI